ncbi:MAG: cation:proton antiporter [Reichenbachiella sp.]
MHFPLLQDILIILGFSVLVVIVLIRFKLPSILGFLITGVIIGPYGLSLVTAVEEVEIIAEIGVILLLFVIGMELSIKQLMAIRKTVFVGGFLQVAFSVIVAAILSRLLHVSWSQAVFAGFLFSLSSTAIVLKVLQDRNEISSIHGRNALAFLIFQDIIVVPMMLITPILAGHTDNLWYSVGELVIKTSLVLVITYLSARYVIPKFMYLITKTQSKELFLLSTIAICFAVAFLTSEAGLSLALGAFIAGLIISDSDYSHQATSTILPFRELFSSFFFISIGMLLDLAFFLSHIGVILSVVFLIVIVKGIIVSVVTSMLGYSFRISILTGLALFQIGEFAFILSKVGIDNGLLSESMNQYFLAVSITTMLLTPFVLIYASNISDLLIKARLPQRFGIRKIQYTTDENSPEEPRLSNHIIIIGYGINGRNVARAAKYANIPYLIVELNPETVRIEKAKGEPIMYGDPVHDHILDEISVEHARVVVLAISDPKGTKAIISNIRSHSQTVHIIVRTRYVFEMDEIIALGADEVIPEEFETSIEIFSRVLNNYLIPNDDVKHAVESIRDGNYELLRPKNKQKKDILAVKLSEFKIVCIKVMADSGPIVGNSLADAAIRSNYGITVMSISRNQKMIHHLLPDEKIMQHDLLYVSGDKNQIEKFSQLVGIV